MARRSWRCFFCDEVFANERDAAEHFGGSQGALTGCQIKGTDGGLLEIVRRQEDELRRLRAEDGDFIRVMRSMEGEHANALRRAEEDGFGKAVREMQGLALAQFGKEVAL